MIRRTNENDINLLVAGHSVAHCGSTMNHFWLLAFAPKAFPVSRLKVGDKQIIIRQNLILLVEIIGQSALPAPFYPFRNEGDQLIIPCLEHLIMDVVSSLIFVL